MAAKFAFPRIYTFLTRGSAVTLRFSKQFGRIPNGSEGRGMAWVKSSLPASEATGKGHEANGRPPARAVRRPAHDPAKELYESIPHAVLVLGRGAHILHANRRAEEILGLSLRKMRGRRPGQLRIAASD